MTEALRLLDNHLADWTVKQFGTALTPELKTVLHNLVKAVSYAAGLQHTCLDMHKLHAINEPVIHQLLQGITLEHLQSLAQYAIPPISISACGQYIWLQKYYRFEQHSADTILSMARNTFAIDATMETLLDTLFPSSSAVVNEQKEAARMALGSQLAIITGGPGTGKTYTVARLIALLLAQNAHCQIVLAAPTGKAAQRMKESLNLAVSADSNFAAMKPAFERVAKSATTLHSLLGIGRDAIKPYRNADNPLLLDVLIVDEASMIDLPMMYRLLDALPTATKNTRLILLGDKDQLASVEAGSVLAELCQPDAIASARSTITVSRRFGERQEIGQLAQWLNGNSGNQAIDFTKNNYVKWHITDKAKQWQPEWLATVTAVYQHLLQSITQGEKVEHILAIQSRFQLLCALNKGPYGVQGINDIIENALGKGKHNAWYSGKPLIILQNDKDRKLYNGDVGMVLPLADDGLTIDLHGTLKACFKTGDELKTIPRNQLPPYQTCYAITVHKSQGSEYPHVMIVLPSDASDVENNPVLARELAYTAITRAKEKIDIYAGEGVLDIMAHRQTVRMSGLAWGLSQ